ncbi:uncharacterized protein [Chlorocebus sabaeus]|uniref:uncharacterized protein isoform X1 n=1 Tax=Chlorocebus sabaeus TaxID=60711 RepID=UPI003BF9BA91
MFLVPMFGDLLKVWRVNLTTPCGASFKEERTQNSCLKKCRVFNDHSKQACSLPLERQGLASPKLECSGPLRLTTACLRLLGSSDPQPPNGLCRQPDGVSWHKKIKTVSPILINFCNPFGVYSIYFKKHSAFHLFIRCKHKSHSKAIVTPWHLTLQPVKILWVWGKEIRLLLCLCRKK